MIKLSSSPAPLLQLLLALVVVTPVAAQTYPEVEQDYPGIRVEQVSSGLGVPWGIAFVSPRQLLVSERSGRLRLLDIENNSIVTLSGSPGVVAEGQGGMLDVAVGPGYADDGWIYFTYSKRSGSEAATTLARARLQQTRLVDWQDLLITDTATDTRRHFGSRIAFDDQGHVFFGVGDRGKRDMAQDLGNHIGTIMRLNLDGSVPADNPFVGIAKARDEIWSYGHRNPQGLLFDRGTGRLWSIEHGPRGGDEINLIEKGRNYGWPVISYGKEYWGPVAVGEGTSKPGMEQPRKVYIPSIAPGSLMLYRGDAFPAWRGSLFAGALKLQHINRVALSETAEATAEERILGDLGERIRALIQGPDDFIYFSTDSGRILRIRPDR
ncbi:MAG: PQQ-dependent sugar dehydrogenase [Gammaproteobacteria bacterium]|nr:PQQ-dependent sugar dehydrogenase [Gammaproteobacteria bacterium]MDH3446771.1 PQQ-dependent sugar dehydrogenase [Gammaproteobacteria bacterium]